MLTSGEKCNSFINVDHSNGKIVAFYLGLMEEFLQFCQNKKEKPDHFHINLNAEQSSVDNFKEKVTMYFGKYLPSNVIDELCKLVSENSYGKCQFCTMPTESLVLSVLQILLDASKKEDGDLSTKSPCFSLNIEKDFVSMKKPGSDVTDHLHSDGLLHGERGIKFQHIGEDTVVSVDCDAEFEEAMCQGNQGTNNFGAKAESIRETSLAMNTTKDLFKKRTRNNGPMHPPHRVPVEKQGGIYSGSKFSPEVQVIGTSDISNKRIYLGKTHDKFSPEVEVVGSLDFGKRCSDLGKIADKMYNKRHLSKSTMNKANIKAVIHESEVEEKRAVSVIQNAPPPNCGLSRRFATTDQELKYYKILCGLAHSDLRTTIGVQFYKTSVTFQSLGESVEPQGHADYYFIAAFCRKYFEDRYPRNSKNHYFYPRIGLCFPIYYGSHWFVFIVDLVNNIFAFLDSFYDQNDMYQIQVRDRLVTSFKECWYEHAEVKTDVDHFQIVYPPTPKQRNPHDCGIFSLMFMEKWDASVDLRVVFDSSDIPNIRVKLANSLFFSSTNLVNKSTVNVFYDQGIDPRRLK